MTPENVLAGTGLAAQRGDRVLFAGLDFALPSGGALLLTGPNGSGKTSLLRLLAGFGRPLAGALSWKGVDIAGDLEQHRQRLHYVGHHDALKPALTVLETLRFWQCLGDGRARVAPRRVLDDHLLTAIADLPCRFLSAGQRRRVALARLDLWPQPLWLLDEPTVGLDQASLGRLTERLESHRAAGGSVVLSTHQPMALAQATMLDLEHYPPAAIEAEAW